MRHSNSVRRTTSAVALALVLSLALSACDIVDAIKKIAEAIAAQGLSFSSDGSVGIGGSIKFGGRGEVTFDAGQKVDDAVDDYKANLQPAITTAVVDGNYTGLTNLGFTGPTSGATDVDTSLTTYFGGSGTEDDPIELLVTAEQEGPTWNVAEGVDLGSVPLADNNKDNNKDKKVDWPDLGKRRLSADPVNCKGYDGEVPKGRAPDLDYLGISAPDWDPVYEGYTNRIYMSKCLAASVAAGILAGADVQNTTCSVVGGGGVAGVLSSLAQGSSAIGGLLVGAGAGTYSIGCFNDVNKMKNTANFINVTLAQCGGTGIAFDASYVRLRQRTDPPGGAPIKDAGLLSVNVSNPWCQPDGANPARPVSKGPFG